MFRVIIFDTILFFSLDFEITRKRTLNLRLVSGQSMLDQSFVLLKASSGINIMIINHFLQIAMENSSLFPMFLFL